jgi:hypothetical protein
MNQFQTVVPWVPVNMIRDHRFAAENAGKNEFSSRTANKSPPRAAKISQVLQALIDAWPALSDASKAGILTARRESSEGGAGATW